MTVDSLAEDYPQYATLAGDKSGDYEKEECSTLTRGVYWTALPLICLAQVSVQLVFELSQALLWAPLTIFVVGILFMCFRSRRPRLVVTQGVLFFLFAFVINSLYSVAPRNQELFERVVREAPNRRGANPAVNLVVVGSVVADPEHPRPGELRFRVDGIAGTVTGIFEITAADLPWQPQSRIRRGDSVKLQARLRSTSSGFHALFSFERALRRRGILAFGRGREIEIISTASQPESARVLLVKQVLKTMHGSDDSTVLLSLILGERHLVSSTVNRLFKETGTSHFLVVSGFHLAVVYGLISRLTSVFWIYVSYLNQRCSERVLSVGAGAVAATMYALVVGSELTVIRSLVVVWIYAFGEILGRVTCARNTLLVSFLVVSMLWPGSFLEPSCQLTFSALIGLWAGSVLCREEEQQLPTVVKSRSQQLVRWFCQIFVMNLSAWICTAPIVIAWFSGISLFSVLVNATIIALLAIPAMFVGFLALICVALHLPGAEILLTLAGAVMQLLLNGLEFSRNIFSELGFPYWIISPEGMPWIQVEFCALAFIWLLFVYCRSYSQRDSASSER